jgi:hypothetical protein
MSESSRKKLFAVYLGGRADRCNIELHDVVFVVGSSIEEAYPLLAKKWFGNLQGFHIDSYVELQNIDGYKIEITKDFPKEESSKKLYFIKAHFTLLIPHPKPLKELKQSCVKDSKLFTKTTLYCLIG